MTRRGEEGQRERDQRAAAGQRRDRELDQREHGVDAALFDGRALDLDEREGGRMLFEEFDETLERGDAFSDEALAELAALGAGDVRELGPIALVDRSAQAAHALELAVVEQDGHAVARDLHVDLDRARASSQRFADGEQRVLRTARGPAAVRDQFGDPARLSLRLLGLHVARFERSGARDAIAVRPGNGYPALLRSR